MNRYNVRSIAEAVVRQDQGARADGRCVVCRAPLCADEYAAHPECIEYAQIGIRIEPKPLVPERWLLIGAFVSFAIAGGILGWLIAQ